MLLLLGGVFLYIFSGFAIDRSKKYIKTIKNDIKIDAVNPQAAADNPAPFQRDRVFFRFRGRRRLAADAAVGRRPPPAANIGGIAAHCCGIFSCTNPRIGRWGWVWWRNCISSYSTSYYGFSVFFDVF